MWVRVCLCVGEKEEWKQYGSSDGAAGGGGG